jgi:hypothetical protein
MVTHSANDNIITQQPNLKERIKQYAVLYRNGSLRQTLYQYLDEGWHLFPVCWFDENGNCACGYRNKETGEPHLENNIGKAPFTKHGMDDATTIRLGVDDFLRKYPKANWAGRFPGQFILDVDVRRNGLVGLAQLKKDIELPPTRTHISGGGGQHIIYRLPQGLKLSASKLNGYEGVDVKINGYIVLPPSIHTSGGVYHVH